MSLPPVDQEKEQPVSAEDIYRSSIKNFSLESYMNSERVLELRAQFYKERERITLRRTLLSAIASLRSLWRRSETPPSEEPCDGVELRRISVSQVWSYSPETGEEWLFLRLSDPSKAEEWKTPDFQSPVPGTRCRLAGVGDFSCSLGFTPDFSNHFDRLRNGCGPGKKPGPCDPSKVPPQPAGV